MANSHIIYVVACQLEESHLIKIKTTDFKYIIGVDEHDKSKKLREKKKLNSLIKNMTWHLVPSPAHGKVIGCKWVYKLKLKADGSIDRYKACLVAKGYHQTAGLDFLKTFSPVVKPITIRVVLTLAISQNWPL